MPRGSAYFKVEVEQHGVVVAYNAGRPAKLPRMAGVRDVGQTRMEAQPHMQPAQATGTGEAKPGNGRRQAKRAARPSSWQRRQAARLREAAAVQESGEAFCLPCTLPY